jgi:fructose-1,6-bisphosphatase I
MNTPTSVVTIERYINEQERNFPEATGELSGLLYDIALAAKMIASKVRMAGLADIIGATHDMNVQGEVQQKLDVIANEIMIKAMDHGGRLCWLLRSSHESLSRLVADWGPHPQLEELCHRLTPQLLGANADRPDRRR